MAVNSSFKCLDIFLTFKAGGGTTIRTDALIAVTRRNSSMDVPT